MAFGSGPVAHTPPASASFWDPSQFAIKPEHRQLGQVRRDHQVLQAEGILPCGQKFLQASEEHLKQHNIDLKDNPLFPELEKCMNSGPVVAMVWRG
ncbi:hypothetical protein J1605_012483 [Eschrichtius robustus]|uniref:nucleoside-diphosphate kinase n=1 Tax=Eschrichtius robustus TaxID=9764 RepID=A0AB34GMG9_ESCRO|nr:hypothetical protein J1605_012483 [Eschrichtius robustus]